MTFAPAEPAARPTVVTGIAAAAPNGTGTEEYWAAVLRGQSGIRRVTRFDPSGYTAQLAGETHLDAAAHLPSRLLVQTDIMTQLALVTARAALDDAGIGPGGPPAGAAGVLTAASAGGTEFAQRAMAGACQSGGAAGAYDSFAWFYPVNSGQISIRHGLRGPGGGLVAGQAGGLDAIAAARRHLRSGAAALMLTGGVDGSLCPWAWVAMTASGELTGQHDPALAYLPFDARASGYVPGEGGALLVLENEADAAARGAPRVYGRVAGYAAAFDARPGTPGEPGLQRAVTLALADAGAQPGDIDAVFADAYGLPDLDRTEAEVLAAVFGPRAVPVAAPKTMTGRLGAGGAPLDALTALLAMRDSLLPPAVNIQPGYSALIDLVTRPRPARLSAVLVTARGHGGFCSAMVLTSPG